MSERDIDHIELKLDSNGKGTLSVNGHPLKTVLGVEVRSDAGRYTEVSIRLIASVDADLLAHINHYNTVIYASDGQAIGAWALARAMESMK